MFLCEFCSGRFTRKKNLDRHINNFHSGQEIALTCFLCGQIFKDETELVQHNKLFHRPSKYFQVRESAFNRAVVSYRYIFDSNLQTPLDCLDEFLLCEIEKTLKSESSTKKYIKFSGIFIVSMNMLSADKDLVTKATIPFRSPTYVSIPSENKLYRKKIKKAFSDHLTKIEEFVNNGSNWVFDRAVAYDIEVAKASPIFTGSSHTVDLSKIKNRKNLLTITSEDNKCFLNCVAWFLLADDKKKSSNISKKCRNLAEKFNVDGMDFPVSKRDISIFLKLNPNLNISINILIHDGKDTFPYLINQGKGDRIINLLMVPTSDQSTLKSINHFVVIKNLDRFLSKTYSKKARQISYENKFYCVSCFTGFSSKNIRDKHFKLCRLHQSVVETVPEPENNKITFKKVENSHMQDLVAYLDFECELKNISENCDKCFTIRCKCDESYTRKENIQNAICYAFVIVNRDNEILHESVYAGENAGDRFLDELLELENIWIRKYLSDFCEMVTLSDKEKKAYDDASHCYLCMNPFSADDHKVRDHNHRDGCFLGAAHNSCNLRRRRQNKLKIFIHNGSSYDFHFLVKSLGKRDVRNLYVLPFNTEKFRMIKFNSFVFLDSLAFLQASLASLSEELYKSGHDYPIIKQTDLVLKSEDGCVDEEKLSMLLQKGFFCYDYW